MKPNLNALFPFLVLAALALTMLAPPAAEAQAPRLDAIWARVASAAPTLDGVLNEPSWAEAESMSLVYGQDAGIPGSGWKIEGGSAPTDPMRATCRFLAYGNQLYLAVDVRDVSIGGSRDFNRFDGLLMSVKDHGSAEAPKPPSEYFYAWWFPTLADPQPPGQSPAFIGRWATWPPGTPRTPTQIANWDAVTVVHGLSNSDATLDTGYTVEMRFNLAPMGYDITNSSGDIVEWNLSIYDCDWNWPNDGSPPMSSNRTWWQGPWGNAALYNEVRVYSRPNVTVQSGALPTLAPEVGIFNGANYPAPQIDGIFSEQVWPRLPTFDIRYGDDALRRTYPAVGPYRAGQYQPPVNGGQAPVLDPGDATVRIFHRGDFLIFGFDVRDQVVQYHPSFDRWDGFLISINDRAVRSDDHNLVGRRLSFQVGPDGHAMPQDYLLTMVQAGTATVALQLKAGTTVDTLGQQADTGWTGELSVNLTALGYPPGLGDRSLFLGINLLDGDSFTPFTESYGTRTWWFREYEGNCCPVWAYLDPGFTSDAPEGEDSAIEGAPLEIGSFPNPGSSPTIRYSLAQPARVTLEVFDAAGALVECVPLGLRPAGVNEIPYDGRGRAAGFYPYRLRIFDPASGDERAARFGKMILVR